MRLRRRPLRFFSLRVSFVGRGFSLLSHFFSRIFRGGALKKIGDRRDDRWSQRATLLASSRRCRFLSSERAEGRASIYFSSHWRSLDARGVVRQRYVQLAPDFFAYLLEKFVCLHGGFIMRRRRVRGIMLFRGLEDALWFMSRVLFQSIFSEMLH